MVKRIQGRAKENLHQIWMAEKKEDAGKAFNHFIESYEAKYPKATECLMKDRDVLLTFYDFPAEHWLHLRTTNPIESMFATVRLRTVNRPERLGELIQGIKFVDGIKQEEAA